MDVPRVLAPYGERGVEFNGRDLPATTFERPRTFATGTAGDVYVCHPFIVHRATWPHRGTRPRMIAQPEIGHREWTRSMPDWKPALNRFAILYENRLPVE